MFEIRFTETVAAPAEKVWQVLLDTVHYAEWNPFIVACESSFVVGEPIVMQVQLLPSRCISQTETIRANTAAEYLEYGIQLPLGLLASSRQHRLTALDDDSCRYESVFILRGALSPLVRLLLGKHLARGFQGMTRGLVCRAEAQR